MSYNIML